MDMGEHPLIINWLISKMTEISIYLYLFFYIAVWFLYLVLLYYRKKQNTYIHTYKKTEKIKLLLRDCLLPVSKEGRWWSHVSISTLCVGSVLKHLHKSSMRAWMTDSSLLTHIVPFSRRFLQVTTTIQYIPQLSNCILHTLMHF